jgi:lipoate-protein ligase A
MQLPKLHFLALKNLPIFEQLQLEEALLRADNGNWCLANSGTPLAIVMGISGNPATHLNLYLLKKKPIPTIKRFSGGGTVVVDEDTLFLTFILNKECSGVPCCPQKIMHWSKQFYEPHFSELFSLQENDYTLKNKKFGGNAQYLCKDRWLHHTSLLWDFRSENMEYLQIPPKMPQYRLKRDHTEFLCKLKDYIPKREDIFEKAVTELSKSYDIVFKSLREAREVLKRPHRKSTSVI